VNSLPQLPSAAQGLPVAFVLRRLLQAGSADEAAALVQALPHATNQHYLIAGPGVVRSFEASAAGVAEFRPPQADRVLHTNHPLSDARRTAEDPALEENSTARLAALTARLSQGPAGFETIAAALSSCDDARHPVCRPPGAAPLSPFTTGSMISRLAREGVTSWISPGPPREAGYRRVWAGSELDG
jgi:hypothetical protein